jgi:hypothetical protein
MRQPAMFFELIPGEAVWMLSERLFDRVAKIYVPHIEPLCAYGFVITS